jgi:hypothetical protein
MDDAIALKEIERLRLAGKGPASIGIVANRIGGAPRELRA